MSASAQTAAPGPAAPSGHAAPGRRIFRNTAIFSAATGLSRIAGLVREVVASSYFATSGAFSAFTIAFQIPNLVRSLFADAALSAAFVPVFTELLEKGEREKAFRLAGTLFFCILAALGAITALFILAANFVIPPFVGHEFTPQLTSLTVGLSRVLFPIVVLLGINGLVVGILNAYDHFSVPAIAPLVWNVVILVILVGGHGLFAGGDQLYAYAIGVLVGTVVQLAISVPVLRRIDFRLVPSFDLGDPRVKQVFKLMIPVTIGLGVINFDLALNSTMGSLISEEAPRAIDAAFRIYMLPQGMFSVALATVLFPALSRLAARGDVDGLRETLGAGIRQISIMLVPAAAFTLALATPIVRLVYEHGAFGAHSTERVATALFWFSFSLPFAGVNLLVTRTFFSLKLPWLPTKAAGASLVVNAIFSVALYRPLGIAGLVIGTALGSAGMTVAQVVQLRPHLHGRLDGRRTLVAVGAVLVASALLGVVSYVVHAAGDTVLGRSLPAQLVVMGLAAVAGLAAYVGSVLWMGLPDAQAVQALVMRKLGR